MIWTVEAEASVLRRLRKCRTPGVREAFDDLVKRLKEDPQFVRPDNREVWGKPFPDVPNHRHADLPGAWRCSWTLVRRGDQTVVVILFLGTHKEYEKRYGFTTR